ncbi:uncharacterized protein LY89DRAFT_609274 [Mollisia scopiformis]|uniref:Uncharacterized protein n=1 Tax=Mollisia scopiformis TaxID=149040 RepID=A0A194XLL4_MOLSC|nr:uncharacterized protein LY89DRAFT_609274 [Mollisia scopiformis]KUJ20974.1 hypothetical protein LY89DRAFT_609274 [Mollisia scopiformis]
MPPSSDQDINNPSSGISQSKLTRKASSAGLQIPSKKERKNGTANGKEKDSGTGGVLAAVTKNASKMSNAKSAQSTRVQSPELNGVEYPPNGKTITSPLLDALSSAALDRSASQNANEWAKNVPAYSSSPSNLINLGESPPMAPYEDRLGWTPREQRGLSNGYVPSASPPSRRRPLSYQLDGNYTPGFDDHRSQVSSYAARRSSMYSQHPRYSQHPPLPHQAQPHFYGAPDTNLMLSPPTPGLIPGDNGYYCGFDSLGVSSQEATKSVNNVVVSGYEGGLKIQTVSKRGLTKVAGIDGLRGGVYNAKILPWTTQGGSSPHFPLVAMVIHGPVWASGDTSSGEGGTPPSEAVSVTQNDSMRGSPRVPGLAMNDTESIESYQTTVEVYSLSTKQHIATLLSVPKVHLSLPVTSPIFKAPSPVGTLTIRANSGHVIIASGTTGETWLFKHVEPSTAPDKFRCIGKVWTTVQHGVTDPSTSSGHPEDWHGPDLSPIRKQYKASILSTNGRWLAYCPPTPSSQTSLRAAVPGVGSTARIPGLNGHAPPQLPSVNCGVDMPDGESMMKQLVQISTQKFIEAGNYLTQQGLQAWNNYRNKPPANQPNGSAPYQNQPNMLGQFPPTHGLPTPAPLVTKDPGIISILDLDQLAHHSSTGSAPHPLATFRVPHGCSFLSFGPSGLALFTASSKGDVQFVWDLMRIQYAKSSFLKGGLQGSGAIGPHVRQIAQFSRMTIARIVDVVWTSPHGERAAMVTEPGTVHILDLPASAFTWPPPRRRTAPQRFDEHNTNVPGQSPPLTASGLASGAVSTLWTAARPLVSRRRRSSAGISARTVTAQAGHGTQALAAGISRSVGAATGKMNEMRKSGTTKLHLPRSPVVPSRACTLLLHGKRNDSVIVLGGGVVRIYTIRNRRADRPADKQKASRGAKYVEFRLPSLPDFKLPPDLARDLHHVGDLELTERDIEESRWKARQASPPAPQAHGTESSIPQAEIESNAPYQPFHTDRRVALHIYSYEEDPVPSPSVSALLSPPGLAAQSKPQNVSQVNTPWAFGGPIKSKKLDVGPPHNSDDDLDLPLDSRALPLSAIERVMRVTDSTEEVEQIVVTTRRRKGASRNTPEGTGDVDEEGFFEDDCEVLDFASQRV